MKLKQTLVAFATFGAVSTAAWADINIGVNLSLTGGGAALGLPMQSMIKTFPQSIAGEKVNVIILDDASDPGKAAQNARRFVNQDKVDVIFGANLTPTTMAIGPIATEAKTVQISGAPGKDGEFVFILPQGFNVMAHAMMQHLKAKGVKTLGFIGYSDGYGEGWLKAMEPMLKEANIKLVGVERFARTDTSVTPQALKLVSANPDAVLVVASGSIAPMPEIALRDRGYKGLTYQTHGAASPDLMRIGGKAVEGTFLVSGPAIFADKLPDGHPSKPVSIDFAKKFKEATGSDKLSPFAGHAYDFIVVMEKAVPIALKKAKPGTESFRLALLDALNTMGRTVISHGVMNWSASDHWGYTNETGVMVVVKNGSFEVLK
jgi:branched-chain amino acid transport system substrate-binding protein|tara:strand:- start:11227 stop:12351 length:1125 start_codon:yes stop_codon:yes gene_type:complete